MHTNPAISSLACATRGWSRSALISGLRRARAVRSKRALRPLPAESKHEPKRCPFMTLPTYEVFAIKYAHRDARRSNHFIGGDLHDAPMPMDYFVWLIRDDKRTIVLDVGFTADMAAKRKRTHLRAPAAGLA